MKQNRTYILQVVLSTMLFFTFSMMHEYDWLIPASPAASAVATSSVPMPDIVEEPGSEDEIEHEDGYKIISFSDRKHNRISLSSENLFIPPVLLPPPDMV